MEESLFRKEVSRRGFLVASVVGSAVFVAGCSLNFSQQTAKGAGKLRYAAPNPETLDPMFVSDGNGIALQGLLEGLTAQNPTGSGAVPAVADKWTMSPDGLTWTFNIRSDAKWSNGDRVTADDFVWTLQRLLTPTGASSTQQVGANTYQKGLGIKGAPEYFAGALKDWSQVGIKAVNDHTLQYTLNAPNPDFLLGLTHISMVPLNRKSVEAHPQDWSLPANWVGNGAFVLKNWVTNTSMTLAPNPNYWDKSNVHLSTVEIRFFSGSNVDVQMVQMFRNNEADIAPIGDPTTFQGDATLTKQLQGVNHYIIDHLTVMWSQHPAFRDVRVRKALSLALDRNALAKARSTNTAPGVSLVTDRVPGWDSSMAEPYDMNQARDLLSQAGYPSGKGIPSVVMLSYRQDPLQDVVAEMWKALGLDIKQDVQEWGVYASRRWKVQPATTVGFYVNGFATQFTQSNYLNSVWGAGFVQQFSLPPDAWNKIQQIQADKSLSGSDVAQQRAAIIQQSQSPEAAQYAQLVQQFNTEPDAAKRNAIFVRAAKIRQATYQFIPFAWENTTYLVKDNVKNAQFRPSQDPFYLKGIEIG